MKVWIHVLLLAASSVAVYSQACPSGHYSAVFSVTADVTTANYVLDDPDLTFFKTCAKARESEVEHAMNSAIEFFNETYGVDFSNSPPDAMNVRTLENARMSPFIVPPEHNLILTDNHWIRTGNTYSLCYSICFGGFWMTFTGEQLLRGSYGGDEGKPAGVGDSVYYGYTIMNVCQQSPLIIQVQSRFPERFEPIDGNRVLAFDLYNKVLGYGTAHGVVQITPVPNQPEVDDLAIRLTFVFPSK